MRKHSDGYEIPAVIDPPTTKCYQVFVPDDPGHITAFLAQIEALSYWYTWQRDPDHKARQLAAIWYNVWNAVRDSTCEAGAMIRQKPGNHCIIQQSTDGVIWSDVVDISLCVSDLYPPDNQPARGQPGAQPGGGSSVPGQCFENVYTIPGNGRVLLPYPIQDGWTIHLMEYEGAWSPFNSVAATWYCPTGGVFFLGTCGIVYQDADGTFPDPTGRKYELVILNPAGVGKRLRVGETYTIPPGSGLGAYTLQMNDSDISNNQGTVTARIQVCNETGQPCGIYHDLQASSSGMVPNTSISDALLAPYPIRGGEWVSGTGWRSTPDGLPNTVCLIELALSAPATITGYRMQYTATGGFNFRFFTYDGSWHAEEAWNVRPSGSHISYDHHAFISRPNVTKVAISALITPTGYHIAIEKFEASC